MDLRFLLFIFALIYFVSLTMSAPTLDKKVHSAIPGASENEIEENVVEGIKDDKKVDAEIDEMVSGWMFLFSVELISLIF